MIAPRHTPSLRKILQRESFRPIVRVGVVCSLQVTQDPSLTDESRWLASTRVLERLVAAVASSSRSSFDDCAKAYSKSSNDFTEREIFRPIVRVGVVCSLQVTQDPSLTDESRWLASTRVLERLVAAVASSS